MNCLICGSSKIEMIDTVVSDFVMARIDKNFQTGKNYKTKLCFCKNCSFAFYDYRFNEDEEYRLYNNYRDEEYQHLREKYECWYTEKVNRVLNSDEIAIEEQRKQIETVLFRNAIAGEIKIALDYGGNEGKTFSDKIGTKEKFVFDISGVKPIDGVTSISSYEDLKKHTYDFIMCNMLFEHLSYPMDTLKKIIQLGNSNTFFYIEVPSENPFIKGNKFSALKNLGLALNPNYSLFRLIKFYLKTNRGCFMPMKEHINFYTEESIRKMIEISNCKIVSISDNKRKSSLGKSEVLSVLFQKNT